MYRLMRRATSLMHTSEINVLINLPLIILVLMFANVKTLIMLMLFIRTGLWATYLVLAGDLVPAGTTLVTLTVDRDDEPICYRGPLCQ